MLSILSILLLITSIYSIHNFFKSSPSKPKFLSLTSDNLSQNNGKLNNGKLNNGKLNNKDVTSDQLTSVSSSSSKKSTSSNPFRSFIKGVGNKTGLRTPLGTIQSKSTNSASSENHTNDELSDVTSEAGDNGSVYSDISSLSVSSDRKSDLYTLSKQRPGSLDRSVSILPNLSDSKRNLGSSDHLDDDIYSESGSIKSGQSDSSGSSFKSFLNKFRSKEAKRRYTIDGSEMNKAGAQKKLGLNHRPKIIKNIMKAVGLKNKKDIREELKLAAYKTKLSPKLIVSPEEFLSIQKRYADNLLCAHSDMLTDLFISELSGASTEFVSAQRRKIFEGVTGIDSAKKIECNNFCYASILINEHNSIGDTELEANEELVIIDNLRFSKLTDSGIISLVYGEEKVNDEKLIQLVRENRLIFDKLSPTNANNLFLKEYYVTYALPLMTNEERGYILSYSVPSFINDAQFIKDHIEHQNIFIAANYLSTVQQAVFTNLFYTPMCAVDSKNSGKILNSQSFKEKYAESLIMNFDDIYNNFFISAVSDIDVAQVELLRDKYQKSLSDRKILLAKLNEKIGKVVEEIELVKLKNASERDLLSKSIASISSQMIGIQRDLSIIKNPALKYIDSFGEDGHPLVVELDNLMKERFKLKKEIDSINTELSISSVSMSDESGNLSIFEKVKMRLNFKADDNKTDKKLYDLRDKLKIKLILNSKNIELILKSVYSGEAGEAYKVSLETEYNQLYNKYNEMMDNKDKLDLEVEKLKNQKDHYIGQFELNDSVKAIKNLYRAVSLSQITNLPLDMISERTGIRIEDVSCARSIYVVENQEFNIYRSFHLMRLYSKLSPYFLSTLKNEQTLELASNNRLDLQSAENAIKFMSLSGKIEVNNQYFVETTFPKTFLTKFSEYFKDDDAGNTNILDIQKLKSFIDSFITTSLFESFFNKKSKDEQTVDLINKIEHSIDIIEFARYYFSMSHELVKEKHPSNGLIESELLKYIKISTDLKIQYSLKNEDAKADLRFDLELKREEQKKLRIDEANKRRGIKTARVFSSNSV